MSNHCEEFFLEYKVDNDLRSKLMDNLAQYVWHIDVKQNRVV